MQEIDKLKAEVKMLRNRGCLFFCKGMEKIDKLKGEEDGGEVKKRTGWALAFKKGPG